MLCMCVLQGENSGDGCELVATLCKYDLRNGDSFVLSWQGCNECGGELCLLSC